MNFTFKFKDLLKLLIFPILVYFVNNTVQFLSENTYLLYSLDTPAHFLGGMAIAYSANYGLSLLEKRNWITIKKPILRCAIILGIVMTIAVWWEFYEFIYDYFLHPVYIMQPSVFDTMKDLYMGMFGAIVYCIGILYRADKKIPTLPNITKS